MSVAYFEVPEEEDLKSVRFERQGPIGRIVLANPPHNLIDSQFSEYLRQAVHDASESDIRVLVVQSEGPNFSFGSDLREWTHRDVNRFRTFIAEINLSLRAIEALKVPTIAAVQGVTFACGFELALTCDLIVAAENTVFRSVEVIAGMVPAAGGLPRLAERVGWGRASRMVMLAEPIPAPVAGQLGIATHVVPEAELAQTVEELAQKLAIGPTKSYAATRILLKAWTFGGIPAADAMMLEVVTNLFDTEDCTRGIQNRAESIERGVPPTEIIFNNR
ncbi:enoyl-CoA hydratase/isomerase family protein [Edaphobacter bradus]|uniref:enoyl-CoA hydratase/isomerase family protein n=1 Tax=Edaphobacter bradus TaxID=2259016 RepID=UPI0021DFE724|nr:enoyl-CoA hydratase/isomerase family protein [Edaphobacter bradus]